MPFVYMLRCADGSLYTGIAKDVPRRLAEHAAGRASRYTRVRLPVTLAWCRRVRTWSRALKEECRIKRLSRAAKRDMIGATRQPAKPSRLLKNCSSSGGSKRSRCKAARDAGREAYLARTSQRRASAPTRQMGLFQQPARERRARRGKA